ncbi:hypothetical protein EIP86_003601 [Pleurotus ostreatoroseus]|nr:hypothetical protein EIP86_003601 [Pleurotus ostreatoroseus]
MDPPSLILIPPTPQPPRSQQPSPLSTNTTASGSSVPELTPSAADKERSSSETTIVTIYSMYEEEVGSWSANDSPLRYDHRRSPSKDVTVSIAGIPSFRDSYHDPAADDSGFYDATYEASKQLTMTTGTRISVLSDDSAQLAYSDSRPPSSTARSSSGTRLTSGAPSDSIRRSQVLSTDSENLSYTRSGSSSRPASQHRTNSTSSASPFPPAGSSNSSPRVSNASPRLSSRPLSTISSLSPDSEPPLSPPPLPRPDSSPLLTVPSTPPTSPPRRSPKISSPSSKLSQISLVPSDGEDPDSFHVRSTYAQLDVVGVKGDGIEEGVERTRARVGGSRASELRAEEALADETEKTRDLTPDEVRLLGSLDRYGFYVIPSHERLILLPAAPLQKPLGRVSTASASAPASPPLLRAQPTSRPPVKELERTAKWGRMLVARSRDEGGNVDLWDVKPKKEPKLSERTFKGIPDCWRSAAWEVLMNRFTKSGKRELQQLAQEYRRALDLPSTYDVQIDLDVPRTISGHVMFRTRYGQG